MQNLFQLGVRDAEPPPSDRRHNSDSGVVKRVAQGVAADHSRRPDDNKTCLAWRNDHDRARCSSQSTTASNVKVPRSGDFLLPPSAPFFSGRLRRELLHGGPG
jgi:hypothetical protein